MNEYVFGRYMDCSLAHVTYEDDKLLDDAAYDSYVLTVHRADYGYWVLVDHDVHHAELGANLQRKGFSEAFILLLKVARANNAQWLKLDADGAVYGDFPTFEW